MTELNSEIFLFDGVVCSMGLLLWLFAPLKYFKQQIRSMTQSQPIGVVYMNHQYSSFSLNP